MEKIRVRLAFVWCATLGSVLACSTESGKAPGADGGVSSEPTPRGAIDSGKPTPEPTGDSDGGASEPGTEDGGTSNPGTKDGGTSNPGTEDGGASPRPGPAEGGVAGNLSCLAILQCIADCDASDTGCADTCVENGSADGQAKAGDLAQCIDEQACTDADCVQTSCAASLGACVESSAPPTGEPFGGPAPAGKVPAELVGSWARANFGQTTRVVLNADGTGTYQIAIASLTTGCTSTSSTSESGAAVVTSDTISIYATDVKTRQTVCSSPSVTMTGDPALVVLQYTHPDADTLKVVDSICAAKYPDSPSSASLYCAETLTRE